MINVFEMSSGQSLDEAAKKRRTLIIGLVVGGIVLLIIIAIVVWFLFFRTPTRGAGAGATQCSSDADCVLGLRCNTSTQKCVLCIGDDDCTGTTPFCKTDGGICVSCLEDDQCDPGTKCSQNDYKCHECFSSSECSAPTPYCSVVGGGECVECNFTSHCQMGEVCDEHVCIPAV